MADETPTSSPFEAHPANLSDALDRADELLLDTMGLVHAATGLSGSIMHAALSDIRVTHGGKVPAKMMVPEVGLDALTWAIGQKVIELREWLDATRATAGGRAGA